MTSLHADEAFIDYYQFTHDPFAARVPGFKFFPARRKNVLGQLHHLARYSNQLLLVTGPHGSGKTLLRQALVASSNKDTVLSIVLSGRTVATEELLLRQIAQGLNIAKTGLEDILGKTAELAITGQEVYLLVDDAEHLQNDCLEALLLLAAGTQEGRLHVFLFGEPELADQLRTFGDDERYNVIELQPYDEEETREYLSQRLEGAGQDIHLISHDALLDIYQESGGWPGRINQAARDVLVMTMLAEKESANGVKTPFILPKKHMIILVVVVLGVLAAWFMKDSRQNSSLDSAYSPTESVPATPTGETEPLTSSQPVIEFSGSSQSLPLPLGDPQAVIREPQAPPEAHVGGPDASQPTSPTGQPIPTQDAQSASAVTPAQPTQPTLREPVATAPVPATPAPAPKPAVPKPAPVQAAKPAAPALGDGAWYGQQSAGNFTIQVLGTGSENNAKAFIGRQNSKEYRYFKKTLNGKPFYVVTYGHFANRAAAQTAIKNLPREVQSGKPWPRTFSSIQQEIQR